MFRKILIAAVAATALAGPAHALGPWSAYNGVGYNGLSLNGAKINGGVWNGAKINGVEQTVPSGVVLLAIELPPASH